MDMITAVQNEEVDHALDLSPNLRQPGSKITRSRRVLLQFNTVSEVL
jgi:hypothetical protein